MKLKANATWYNGEDNDTASSFMKAKTTKVFLGA